MIQSSKCPMILEFAWITGCPHPRTLSAEPCPSRRPVSPLRNRAPGATERYNRQQSPLLPGLHSSALYLSDLGDSRDCSLYGHLMSFLQRPLPSPQACTCREAKLLHTWGLGCLVSVFTMTSLSFTLDQQLRGCSPKVQHCPLTGNRQEELEPSVLSQAVTLME